MADAVVAERDQKLEPLESRNPKAVDILGVPLAYGASMAGVELGPAALRVAPRSRCER